MNKIIEYMSSIWKKAGREKVKQYEIYEKDYKWIADYVIELGFSNVYSLDFGLNQEFKNPDKNLRIILSIELSHKRRDWDVINLQLISNKEGAKGLKHKWSAWRSFLNKENFEKEIRNVSEAFSSVNVSYGDKEPLLLYNNLKLEDIYSVPTHSFLVRSDSIEDMVIKTYNLGCRKLSNIRTIKREDGCWDGIDKSGHPIGDTMWSTEFVGIANNLR